jgi:hypothetical protein
MKKEKLEIVSRGDVLLKKVSQFVKENKRIQFESKISSEKTQEIIDLLSDEITFLTKVLDKNNQQNK